jgi:hypothetical protein
VDGRANHFLVSDFQRSTSVPATLSMHSVDKPSRCDMHHVALCRSAHWRARRRIDDLFS